MSVVTFLLPGAGCNPIGGFKVVYEYSNRLVADGYEVNIIYPAVMFFKELSFRKKCRTLVRYVYRLIFRNYTAQDWFPLDDRVKEYWVWSLAERNVPSSDFYVATAIKTSVYLNDYNYHSNSKLYLIQGFENWGGISKEEVLETYHFPLRKIIISNWLKKVVEDSGEQATLICNGFDFRYFIRQINPEDRDRYHVAMLYHKAPHKGCEDAFKALDRVKEKYPQLKVSIFGSPPRPIGLPDWYDYHQRPDRETHNRIYNEAAIFVGPSRLEGWGLTVGEAMMCGCAVACTDNPGFLEMATDGDTALLSPVNNPERLACNIQRLIEDDTLRYRIAEEGYKNIQKFTWEQSYSKLKNILSAFDK